MIIKQYTENDYLLWWAIDTKSANVDHDYIICNPTKYAMEEQLGNSMDGFSKISLYDDFNRSIKDKRLLTTMFMTSGQSDGSYSALSGEPIKLLGESIRIKLHIHRSHKNLVPGDYWYGEDRDAAYFTPIELAVYFLRCSIEGNYIDPKLFAKTETFLTSIFAPKTEEEILDANAWSYITFGRLWDCDALDEEFRQKSGLDMIMQTRSEACYI